MERAAPDPTRYSTSRLLYLGLISWSIEALVFLLTGLQARAVILGISGEGWNRALTAGALVSLAVILVRFVWVFPATYLPRLIPTDAW